MRIIEAESLRTAAARIASDLGFRLLWAPGPLGYTVAWIDPLADQIHYVPSRSLAMPFVMGSWACFCASEDHVWAARESDAVLGAASLALSKHADLFFDSAIVDRTLTHQVRASIRACTLAAPTFRQALRGGWRAVGNGHHLSIGAPDESQPVSWVRSVDDYAMLRRASWDIESVATATKDIIQFLEDLYRPVDLRTSKDVVDPPDPFLVPVSIRAACEVFSRAETWLTKFVVDLLITADC